MRASRAVRRIDKSLVSHQATRNLATTTITRPAVINGARNNRRDSEITRRGLTSTSRAAASTSTSRHDGASHVDETVGKDDETVGKDVEAGTPEPDLTGLPTSTDLLEVYRGMVAQGRLAYDPEQVRIVMKVCLSLPGLV
jgi:hypothetical protein